MQQTNWNLLSYAMVFLAVFAAGSHMCMRFEEENDTNSPFYVMSYNMVWMGVSISLVFWVKLWRRADDYVTSQLYRVTSQTPFREVKKHGWI